MLDELEGGRCRPPCAAWGEASGVPPVDEPGHQRDAALVFAHVEHADDARMIQVREQVPFIAKAFRGTRAVMLQAYDDAADPETRYVADTAYLKDLEIRPGFRSYGCRVHFAADQSLLGIFDYEADRMVSAGDADWAHVKHLAKQSLAI